MLKMEYQKKMDEVKNLENLELAIQKQLENLVVREKQMNEEMENKFNNISQIETDAANEKQQLLDDKRELTSESEDLKIKLKQSEFSFEKAKNKLNRHKLYQEMTKLEKKVANNGKSIYNFKSYIQGKSKDMNYSQIQNECNDLIDQLNQSLITRGTYHWSCVFNKNK